LPQQPPVGHGPLIHEVCRFHRTTHHSRQDSSGRAISSSRRTLPDNTQHSQPTDIQVTGEIRTHNLSSQAAADLCLRLRGHWDRHSRTTGPLFYLRTTVCHFLRLNRSSFGYRMTGICWHGNRSDRQRQRMPARQHDRLTYGRKATWNDSEITTVRDLRLCTNTQY